MGLQIVIVGAVAGICKSDVAFFEYPNGQRIPISDKHPHSDVHLARFDGQRILNVFHDHHLGCGLSFSPNERRPARLFLILDCVNYFVNILVDCDAFASGRSLGFQNPFVVLAIDIRLWEFFVQLIYYLTDVRSGIVLMNLTLPAYLV